MRSYQLLAVALLIAAPQASWADPWRENQSGSGGVFGRGGRADFDSLELSTLALARSFRDATGVREVRNAAALYLTTKDECAGGGHPLLAALNERPAQGALAAQEKPRRSARRP